MKFSQRIGITPTEKILQINSMDEDLKNALWNVLIIFYWSRYGQQKYYLGARTDRIKGSHLECLLNGIWIRHFKKPIDTIPRLFYSDKDESCFLKKYFFEAKWYEVYDFIELVAEYDPPHTKTHEFIDACNTFLEIENSAYRFIDGNIIAISSSDEIQEIEFAIEKSSPYYGVKQHLKAAISMLSDRENPDYRNSIKESISAVESLCKKVSGNDKATLGEALKTLEKDDKLHPALNPRSMRYMDTRMMLMEYGMH